MNDRCNIFIYSNITVQRLLNKPLDKRETDNWLPFLPQQPFPVVENLLRVYIVYYQHGYISIQQFNKISEHFQLFFADRIKTSHLPYGIVMAIPKSVITVGDISQTVGCRCELPAFLQNFPYLVFFRLDLCACQ